MVGFGGGGGNIVSSNTFNISMIDASGGEEFIRRHGASIAGVVGEAVKNSQSFAAQIQGA